MRSPVYSLTPDTISQAVQDASTALVFDQNCFLDGPAFHGKLLSEVFVLPQAHISLKPLH